MFNQLIVNNYSQKHNIIRNQLWNEKMSIHLSDKKKKKKTFTTYYDIRSFGCYKYKYIYKKDRYKNSDLNDEDDDD